MKTDVIEILKVFWPLIILSYGFVIWVLVDIIKRKRVRFLPKIAWAGIAVVFNLTGSIVYLIFGRSE